MHMSVQVCMPARVRMHVCVHVGQKTILTVTLRNAIHQH